MYAEPAHPPLRPALPQNRKAPAPGGQSTGNVAFDAKTLVEVGVVFAHLRCTRLCSFRLAAHTSFPTQSTIKQNYIVVFSKSYCVSGTVGNPEAERASRLATHADEPHDHPVFVLCSQPYCRRAKSLISSIPDKKSEPKIIELDLMDADEGAQVQAYLAQKTGQRTVPNVFIGQKHIGGADRISELNEAGELVALVTG